MCSKFEVGKTYKGVNSGSLYKCAYSGNMSAVLTQNGKEYFIPHSDKYNYEEYTPPKVEVKKMYVHVSKELGARSFFINQHDNYSLSTNEPLYLTFTDGKLTAVSLEEPNKATE